MNLAVDVLYIWAVGCIFSWILLALCTKIGKNTGLNNNAMKLGISLSWLVVGYFMFLAIRGYILSRKVVSSNIPFVKPMSDEEMLKITIDDYWVPAVQSDMFDSVASLPIANSPLCKEYYYEGRASTCKSCPVHKLGFGCTAVNSLWSRYSGISGTGAPRQDMAIKMAKLFTSIYKEQQIR